eukprot:TRINITY_DN12171_c0_g1_i1.p1 TRINITY_DN12171_c0_g1~~TRINITY_DN12171_c0_g1_i1.p1  ORF type:complete len:370 (+),score=68.52 TRINITY_DN12171_c0_g1_i1:178-1287(+)
MAIFPDMNQTSKSTSSTQKSTWGRSELPAHSEWLPLDGDDMIEVFVHTASSGRGLPSFGCDKPLTGVSVEASTRRDGVSVKREKEPSSKRQKAPPRHLRRRFAEANDRFFQCNEVLPLSESDDELGDCLSLPSPRDIMEDVSPSNVLKAALKDGFETPVPRCSSSRALRRLEDQCCSDGGSSNDELEELDLLSATAMVRASSASANQQTCDFLQKELMNFTASQSIAWQSPRVPAALERSLEQTSEDVRLPAISSSMPPSEGECRIKVQPAVRPKPQLDSRPLYLRMREQFLAKEQQQLAAAKEQRQSQCQKEKIFTHQVPPRPAAQVSRKQRSKSASRQPSKACLKPPSSQPPSGTRSKRLTRFPTLE